MQLTPEQIERMRAIGLRLDRAGTFWHDGSAVTHPRLRQALLRWLDVRDDGRDIVRLDDKRYAYVEIEDAHLRATSARWDGERCFILWDDDQEEELDYTSLRQAPDNAIYVRARGTLRGRIAGPAYHALTERIVERSGSAGPRSNAQRCGESIEHGNGFALRAAGQLWPITTAAST